jgi:hypothetical protein
MIFGKDSRALRLLVGLAGTESYTFVALNLFSP